MLYISNRHMLFKLSRKRAILVPQYTSIPMTDSIIKRVNAVRIEEKDLEGIEFIDLFGNITINNIDIDLNQSKTLK